MIRRKTDQFSAVLFIFLPILAAEAQDVDVPGNLTMRDSTGLIVGNILKGGVPFIHNFGDRNTFIGKEAGNFTTTGIANNATGGSALDRNLLTIDHFVSHTSTVPANAGERVELFVRERVQDDDDRRRPVVLMLQGATQPTVPIFDLQFENYSWMGFLAHAGFDVFAMDLTGYGLSPRPTMDDACNASEDQQRALLIPNPLPEICPASYPFKLTTSQSDWDEIDTVVDYLRELRHVRKVNLIGWSLGGPRAGGYAARHPDKVKRLFLYAPAYDRLEPSEPPHVLPQPGVPMTIATVAAFFRRWDSQVRCENQFNPAIRDTLRSTILEFDPVGSTWGSEALWRAPLQTRWGWNAMFAVQVEAPTLLIRGDLDTQVPEPDVRALYEDLGSEQKVFVHVACAAHQLVWENQHMSLLRASEEWLREGTFADQRNGSFFVDAEGLVHPDQSVH